MPTAYSPALQPNQQLPPVHSLKHILPSPQFVRFVNYVLQTTQVGQAAVLLSILYLERYRRFVVSSAKAAGGRHRGGNEFRLFVTSLMLANKTLDDNTYTNATWSSISGLPLVEINSMEREATPQIQPLHACADFRPSCTFQANSSPACHSTCTSRPTSIVLGSVDSLSSTTSARTPFGRSPPSARRPPRRSDRCLADHTRPDHLSRAGPVNRSTLDSSSTLCLSLELLRRSSKASTSTPLTSRHHTRPTPTSLPSLIRKPTYLQFCLSIRPSGVPSRPPLVSSLLGRRSTDRPRSEEA